MDTNSCRYRNGSFLIPELLSETLRGISPVYFTDLLLGLLMTYIPLAETYDCGTAYWESLGLLGSSTGMKPILSLPTALTIPDAYTSGLTVAVNDSVVTQTTSGDDWVSWNFLDSGSRSYSKVLAVGYGMADYFDIGVS